MSIRKRSWTTTKGEHREAWIVDYTDQHRQRHTKTFKRKKDADAWLVDAAHEIKRGTHTADHLSITVGEAGDRWVAGADGLERSTVKQYRNHLNHHIRPLIGAVKLSHLTAPMVRKFEVDLREGGRSAAMVRKVRASLAMLIGDAQDRGLVTHNVVRERNRTKSKKTKKARKPKIKAGVDFPTVEEARLILEASEGRWRPLIATAIFTGMRASELRGLVWRDVDLNGGILNVRQRADEWGEIGDPKSEAGERSIPIGEFLLNTLKAWRLEYPRPIIGKDGDGKPIREAAKPAHLVFPNGKGNVESHANIYRRCFGEIQLRCGVVINGKPKYGPHSFRHYAISTFIDMGHPPKRVQDIAGHSILAMTMDTYGHLFPDTEGDQDMMRRAELRLVS